MTTFKGRKNLLHIACTLMYWSNLMLKWHVSFSGGPTTLQMTQSEVRCRPHHAGLTTWAHRKLVLWLFTLLATSRKEKKKKKLGRSNGWKYLQSILSTLRKNPWRQWELTAGISAAEEQAMLGQQVQNCRWDSQLWELGIDGPQRTQEAKPARVRLNISQSEGAHMQ